jgi:5'-nucleotidase/UDP-sugar diphosphatase
LARRATVITNLKKEGKGLLILDAGNSLFKANGSPSSKDRETARLIATAYQRMGYQAVNVGSNDLSAGIKFLRDLQRKTHLPLLSANLLNERGGKPIFKTHLVFDVDGIRVGLLGLTSDARRNESETPEEYFISNPIPAAKSVAARLERDCDMIVALGNLGSFKEYTKLVQGVKGIHFILGSGGKRFHHQTIQSHGGWKALLFQTYAKGQYLGRVDLKLVKGNRDFVDLSPKAQMEKQIKSIERQLESYRRGTGSAKSIPQDKREESIKRLEDFKKRTEARLEELEKDSHKKSTFINTPIRLDDKVTEDPETRELVNRFKKGS